jgi:hypothetical protein
MNPTNESREAGKAAAPAMPSRAGLGKHLRIALAGATVILAVFILPAEYGMDPTGLGGRMGLLALSSAAAQIPDIPMAPPETARFYPTAPNSNVIEIPLELDGALEYKVRMKAGETLVYSWSVDNGTAYYDFHAESEPDGARSWLRSTAFTAGTGSTSKTTPSSSRCASAASTSCARATSRTSAQWSSNVSIGRIALRAAGKGKRET